MSLAMFRATRWLYPTLMSFLASLPWQALLKPARVATGIVNGADCAHRPTAAGSIEVFPLVTRTSNSMQRCKRVISRPNAT